MFTTPPGKSDAKTAHECVMMVSGRNKMAKGFFRPILSFTYMFLVCFVVCLLLSSMSTDVLTVEALRSILDEKRTPLKTDIAELR